MARGQRGPGALAEPRRLMRTGLGLIVLGHGSLVLGAIVHGSVLRHVAGTRRAVTPEYAAANVVSVCSGLLSIAAGIVAILVSHNLSRAALLARPNATIEKPPRERQQLLAGLAQSHV